MAHAEGSRPGRGPQERRDDHAAIDRLADELLPALVAKLGASGLGELEVREGSWRVRLRLPADGPLVIDRRAASGRPGSRAADGPRGEHPRGEAGAPAAGVHAAPAPGRPTEGELEPSAGPARLVAISPAVGYFRPRADLAAGAKVRAGDRIGSVDVLGIGQDLVAPGDGMIGATLVAPGEPVEYGQAVIVLEQLAEPRPGEAGAAAAQTGRPPGGTPAAGAA